ncbi:hypothetical protein T4B_14421 [Trichinella pseudospiralis]|uniref:Uncharacterized protein n=1 Tax=Trichinella pseudospiralis TaxID=6337 RepID=A0A0V1K5Z4_TRIPS|nr:hypothetical protein T4A_7118 [Trichinella pseudospiralis]KRZ30468.1 hypothetical protein T4B_14421 [Trichinella pseudospiralis]KRZ42653.1 hypothetical protein T4C_12015 [Trichinella pseudospiralis]
MAKNCSYEELITLGGTRTRSLRFRRPTPSPLGHKGLLRFAHHLLDKYNKQHRITSRQLKNENELRKRDEQKDTS